MLSSQAEAELRTLDCAALLREARADGHGEAGVMWRGRDASDFTFYTRAQWDAFAAAALLPDIIADVRHNLDVAARAGGHVFCAAVAAPSAHWLSALWPMWGVTIVSWVHKPRAARCCRGKM
jgi:hypothetical protein